MMSFINSSVVVGLVMLVQCYELTGTIALQVLNVGGRSATCSLAESGSSLMRHHDVPSASRPGGLVCLFLWVGAGAITRHRLPGVLAPLLV